MLQTGSLIQLINRLINSPKQAVFSLKRNSVNSFCIDNKGIESVMAFSVLMSKFSVFEQMVRNNEFSVLGLKFSKK